MAEGYEVESEGDAVRGLARGSTGTFDAILLDVMLPGGSGFDVCRTLRQRGIQTPILMLTARGQVVDRVVGLKLGADDYLVKPLAPRRYRVLPPSLKHFASATSRSTSAKPRSRRQVSRSSCPRASSNFSATSSSIAVPHSHAMSCSTKSGATTPCRPHERSTCTSRGCGRRSKTTRDIRNTFTPSTGSGINSSGESGPQSTVHGHSPRSTVHGH